ncbi:hypothetical protein COV94_06130, partial [Candidatus Woesearchaeota archaeon CG11_big_fil_rev_8_21_14_0_20_57_5]
MDAFTLEEEKLLSRFVSNMRGRVFVLQNLPEVIKGALFSRYSRSQKGLRRLLLDEFILAPETGFSQIAAYAEESGISQTLAIKKAQEFYDRILDGYGDDSIGELGGAHVALEGISNIATKFIQDRRIGGSPLEKSTRYVYFDDKVDSRWQYCRATQLMGRARSPGNNEHAQAYEQTCDTLFAAYSKLMPVMQEFFTKRYPKEEGVSEKAYAFTVRARACDALRGLLPASTLTNMGVFGNGRFFEYLIACMRCSGLAEIESLAEELQQELDKTIPSFVRRCKPSHKHFPSLQQFLQQRERQLKTQAAQATESIAKATIAPSSLAAAPTVKLIESDKRAEEKIIAHALYQHTDLPLEALLQYARRLPTTERNSIIAACVAGRENRRHKPPRAFENVFYTFDILADFGAYRDLHRHRMLTQERQLLTVEHGYVLPEEVVAAGVDKDFKAVMDTAARSFGRMSRMMPQEAQYVVPLAFRVRWYITINLRSLFWFSELRSVPQ